MKIVLVCLVAVSATIVSAIDGPGSPPDDGYGPRRGYGGPGYGGPGYGGARGAGPRGPYFGSRGGYGRPGPYYGGYDEDHKPLDIIDKLYKRVSTTQSEVKTTSEILANLEARQSLQKKTLEQLTLQTFPDHVEEDNQQERRIIDLELRMDSLAQYLSLLEVQYAEVALLNVNVTLQLVENNNLYAERKALDADQTRRIRNLAFSVGDFKEKLFDVIGNEMDSASDNIDQSKNDLDIKEGKELKKMCESGQVTLDADDRKAEYLFQTEFASVPQVLYSVCGYNFNLEAREGQTYDNYYKEPNAIGLSVTADASKTGVTLEVFDKSFGDTALASADVCFQACNISPGRSVSESSRTKYAPAPALP